MGRYLEGLPSHQTDGRGWLRTVSKDKTSFDFEGLCEAPTISHSNLRFPHKFVCRAKPSFRLWSLTKNAQQRVEHLYAQVCSAITRRNAHCRIIAVIISASQSLCCSYQVAISAPYVSTTLISYPLMLLYLFLHNISQPEASSIPFLWSFQVYTCGYFHLEEPECSRQLPRI